MFVTVVSISINHEHLNTTVRGRGGGGNAVFLTIVLCKVKYRHQSCFNKSLQLCHSASDQMIVRGTQSVPVLVTVYCNRNCILWGPA